MLASYHNHSSFSDGKGPIAELLSHARSLGVEELGVSDHLTLHPDGQPVSWSMCPKRLGEYLGEARGLASRSRSSGGPLLRVGLEVDWFDGQEEVIRETLAGLDLDFVIGGVHFVGEVAIDSRRSVWERLTQGQVDEVFHGYWGCVKKMAQSRLFGIAAHLDLPKKFGFSPRCDLSGVIDETLDAIAEAGMVVELNTAGWHCPCREPYPGPSILRRCRARDIGVTISADAHDPQHIVRDFAEAAGCLRSAGYDEVARFAEGRVRFEAM